MPLLSQLLRFVIEWRIDTIALCLTMAITCAACRAYAHKAGATTESFRTGCLSALLIMLAGALLAEWTEHLPGAPANPDLGQTLVTRVVLLGAATFSGGVILWTTLRLALIGTKLRVHLDAERHLELAKIAAADAKKAKGDFLAVMSHEIRTPLNAVMGFAKLLLETRLDETQRGYVSTITCEGERLSAFIGDMLDLTKIEGGQLVLESVPFAPVEVAREILRLFSVRAAEKRIELRFEAQLADPLLVSGDSLRFRQILINLVDNALKFTPSGTVTVFLSWLQPNPNEPAGRLTVRVRDTGIGIPIEKQHKLFQLFTQVDSSTNRAYGGAGVGLAICQRLIGLMGGEITVSSDRGEGAEFKFWLPLAPVASSEAFALTTETAHPFARPPRVLVVDDLETNRFLLEVFLRRNGFEPELAGGGAEAVRLATANRYDAILMDLQMPEVDGYTATTRIRAVEPPGRRTPIIALTASIGKGVRDRCLAAGMDEHMTKPLDLARFKRLLKSSLGVMAAA